MSDMQRARKWTDFKRLVKELKPDFLVIDSIQTMSCGDLPSAPQEPPAIRQ